MSGAKQLPQLSPEIQAQLEQLKDIHLPEPISWWPLAIGWWIVIAVCLIAVIGGIGWSVSRRGRLQKSVLAELHNLPSNDPVQFASELSALLRRVAIYVMRDDDAQAVQNLSGDAWADFLSAGDKGFERPLAEVIANAPYSGAVSGDFDEAALRLAAQRWIVARIV